MLSAMHDEKEGEGLVVALPSERAMARNVRRWLWKAGVRRPELHEGPPTEARHDLHATGATWMAVRGDDDPLKIKQRCGHTTFATTEIYIREAEAVREGFGEVFLVLPEVLIQFVRIRTRCFDRARKTGALQRGGRDSKSRGEALCCITT